MTGTTHRNGRYMHTKKIILNTKPEGKYRVGRPKLRWLEDVETDIKSVDIKRWRLTARDRKELTVIPREAEAKLEGPLSYITVLSVLHVAP
jgi:hypothetical protein